MNVYIGGAKDFPAMRGPCDEGFHVPTGDDYTGLSSIMTTLGLGTDWSDKLHLPLAGWRRGNTGDVGVQGEDGRYWLNELSSSGNFSAGHFLLYGTKVSHGIFNKAYGMSIRPFKDNFVKPASTWTVIAGTLGSAGIFRDTVNGLISITGDGTTGYTISDKNLGASTVWSTGDTLSEANCGKYYQRGNNYGFAWTGAITTSSTHVDASSYGPGNYYSSSTFITASGSTTWDSSNNDNLRGLVTGIVSPGVLKNAYIGEYVEITETYTMSNISGGTRIWTSNLYKSGYKITKIVQEGTITCTSSNEARQGIFNDTNDTSQTNGIQSYYGFNAYSSVPEKIEKYQNDSWTSLSTLSSSYYSTTVNFKRETTATQIKTSYNGHTMTYDLNSSEQTWWKAILEGNSVYCTSQISNYGGSPLGTISTVTVTVTYEPN